MAAREQAAAERTVADAVQRQAAAEAKMPAAREASEDAESKYRRSGGKRTDVDDNRMSLGGTAAGFALGGLPGALVGGAAGRGYDQTRMQAREAEAENAKKALDAAQGRADQAQGNTDAQVRAKAAADSNVRKAQLGVTRAELGDAREREGEAVAGARLLGGLGRAGRQEAKVALEMVKRLGVDNVDPETVAIAEAADPKTVGNMKEQAGEEAKKEFRDLAPDEKRLAGIGQARGKVKGLDEKERTQEQDDLKKSADDAAKRITETGKVIVDSYKAITAALKALKREMERAAGNASP